MVGEADPLGTGLTNKRGSGQLLGALIIYYVEVGREGGERGGLFPLRLEEQFVHGELTSKVTMNRSG